MKKFSKREAIRFGWNTVKGNIGLFIGIGILSTIFSFSPDLIQRLFPETAILLRLLAVLSGVILPIIIMMGLINISIKFNDNIKVEFSDFFSKYYLFFKVVAASIISGILVLLGFIFFIVPGIILIIKFQFVTFLIIDQEMGPIEALRKSYAITKGVKWELYLFAQLLFLINILGLLAFVVGILVTYPLTFVARAFVYRRLLSPTTPPALQPESQNQV